MRAVTAKPASVVTLCEPVMPEVPRLEPSAWYFSNRAMPVVSTNRKSSAPVGRLLNAAFVGAKSV